MLLLIFRGEASYRARHHFFCDRSYKTKMVNQRKVILLDFI